MKKFLKWFGIPIHDHEWSKWKTQGNIVIGEKQLIVGYWQTRQCSRCGEIEIKKVW